MTPNTNLITKISTAIGDYIARHINLNEIDAVVTSRIENVQAAIDSLNSTIEVVKVTDPQLALTLKSEVLKKEQEMNNIIMTNISDLLPEPHRINLDHYEMEIIDTGGCCTSYSTNTYVLKKKEEKVEPKFGDFLNIVNGTYVDPKHKRAKKETSYNNSGRYYSSSGGCGSAKSSGGC